ncbi:MAG: hypothetical protein SAK29_30570 [Scytonema sp. PMC 1069.18]|nr:hypothetical protein [Scytonema sp. PMC 1069.18]MEC4888128.1 hypothetical protein [Scytonema sp. PMC 1070.18]
MASLKQAISQDKIQVLSEPPLFSSEEVDKFSSEPQSELLKTDFNKRAIEKGQRSYQNTNSPSELLNESLLIFDGELELISLDQGELLNELPTVLSENDDFSSELLSEPLSESSKSILAPVEAVDAKAMPETQVSMELAHKIPDNLTGAALARRLGVSDGSISRNKTKENFGQWTSQHDPDGITWHFDGKIFRRQS